MDTLITTLVSTFVNQGIQTTKESIFRILDKNKSEAIKKSISELDDLIRIIHERLSKLERSQIIEDNYRQSDYYHLISKSFQSASNFPSKAKTLILAEIIVKRIRNAPNDNENVLLTIVAEKSEYLMVKHLKLLAVMYALGFNNLFDRFIMELPLTDLTPETLDQRLSFIKGERITIQDLKFLVGIGVLDIIMPTPRTSRSFESIIFDYPFSDNPISPEFKKEFAKTQVGQIFQQPELQIGHFLFNPFGLQIGREAYKVFSKFEF